MTGATNMWLCAMHVCLHIADGNLGVQVSSGLSAWTAHLLVLKLVLWLLGVPSAVPFLEALCYTGYPLVSVCINTVVVTLLGEARPYPPACLIQSWCQQSTQGSSCHAGCIL